MPKATFIHIDSSRTPGSPALPRAMKEHRVNNTLFNILHRRWKKREKEDSHVFRFTEKELRYMMQKLCEKVGVKPFGFHSIRHHVASVVNDSGKASMKQIQVLLRHKRQATTETYLHVMGEGIAILLNLRISL